MTKKDLFTIVFKLFGLYLFIQILIFIFSLIVMWREPNFIDVLSIFLNVVYLFLTYLLLYKSNLIIDLFKLTEGFDNDKISLNINEKGIVSVGLIFISIYLIVMYLGDFITQTIMFFNDHIARDTQDPQINLFGYSSTNYERLFNALLCLMIGFLILSNHKRLTNWILKLNQ